ncbi:hypothetical protein [Marinicella marina]|jgi:hypothetical protein|uniref:hypothetical protein n=1 Tax=Marinicella marina TaxID=2996016 RepID=UPI0024BC7BAD|nr:hypothetical protein [Marinicella marina]
MSNLTLQEVTALFEINDNRSEKRHDDLKEEMREGFSKLEGRVGQLEQQEKPLITWKTVKWASTISVGALITTYAGGLM